MNEPELFSRLAIIQDDGLLPPIRNWILGLLETARELRQVHNKGQKLELLLDEAMDQLNKVIHGVDLELGIRESLHNRTIPPKTKSWSDEDYLHARSILKVAPAS